MEPGIAGEGPTAAGRGRWNRNGATAVRLADLDPSQRKRAVFRSAAIVAGSCVLIVGAFYVLPIGRESGLRAFLRAGADIAPVGAVFVWQFRRIHRAELPELRAVEALGIVITVFLVGFSAIYLAMSHEAARTFTGQPLDHTRALYFTITIFSTVGFGDITPTTDTARLVVAAQMLLDLAIIGAVVRLLFNAARSRINPAASQPGAEQQ